jgi:hypothetical protein
MPKPHPVELIETVRKLAASGMTSKQIGETVQMPPKNVQRIFQKHNIPCLPRGATKGNRSANTVVFDEARAIQMYLDGKTYKQIAQELNIVGSDPVEIVRARLTNRYHIQSRVGKASGSDNPQWKGKGQRHQDRYNTYRVVVAFLGTLLPKGWVVHHLDENETNDSPANLCLFPSAKLHNSHHQWLLKNQLKGDSVEAIREVLKIGGHLLLPREARFAASHRRGLTDLLSMEAERVGFRTKWRHLIDPQYQPRVPLKA